MGRQRENLAVQTVQELPIEEKKEGEGKKANVDSQEPEERSLVKKSKHRTRNGSQKKIVLGGPKEIEAREAFRKVMKAFREVEFRAYQPEKGASNVSTRTKEEARTNKERARKVLILNMDFQLRKH